jgi:hypothetical protein
VWTWRVLHCSLGRGSASLVQNDWAESKKKPKKSFQKNLWLSRVFFLSKFCLILVCIFIL